MSRFRKQSQAIWFCAYHIVWCPKYRFRVIQGKVKEEVEAMVGASHAFWKPRFSWDRSAEFIPQVR